MSWHLIIQDVLVLGGLSAISYGAWMAYHPAGFMVAGAGLLVAVVDVPHLSQRKPPVDKSARRMLNARTFP